MKHLLCSINHALQRYLRSFCFFFFFVLKSIFCIWTFNQWNNFILSKATNIEIIDSKSFFYIFYISYFLFAYFSFDFKHSSTQTVFFYKIMRIFFFVNCMSSSASVLAFWTESFKANQSLWPILCLSSFFIKWFKISADKQVITNIQLMFKTFYFMIIKIFHFSEDDSSGYWFKFCHSKDTFFLFI